MIRWGLGVRGESLDFCHSELDPESLKLYLSFKDSETNSSIKPPLNHGSSIIQIPEQYY